MELVATSGVLLATLAIALLLIVTPRRSRVVHFGLQTNGISYVLLPVTFNEL
jgi:hypothetical protein